MVELVLLGLLGVAVTWGIVEWVRDDDDGGGGAEPEPQEPVDRDMTLLDGESLQAGGGNDTITGGTADDLLGSATLRGGAGNDMIEIHAEQADIDGNRGDDTIRGTLHGGIVRGGPGDDTIEMTIRDATASGGEGDDAITAAGYNATLAGGAGNDTIDASDLLAGTVRGNEGDDLLIFDNPHGEQAWRADGGEGNDTLQATLRNSAFAEPPSMTGGAGDDLFDIAFHDIAANFRDDDPVLNITDFTRGEDLLRLDIPSIGPDAPAPSVFLREAEDGSGTHVVVEYLATEHYNDDDTREVMVQNRIWLDGATGLTADDIEVVGHAIAIGEDLTATDGGTLQGGAGDDRITAPDAIASADVQGGAGDDLIELTASNTLVHGNQGDDSIRGYYDGSVVRGGHGDDDISVIADGSIIMGNDGDDLIVAEAGYNATLTGGAGNDTLDGSNIVRGMVHGEDGDDLLILDYHANPEASHAYGGAGNDTLRATGHHDALAATSSLTGGEGEDTFDIGFTKLPHVPPNWQEGPDTERAIIGITDFTPGEDVLRLDITTGGEDSPPPNILIEEAEDGSGTRVVIEYTAIHDDDEDTPPEEMTVRSIIWLRGATGVTMDDIEIVPAAA